MNNKEEGIKDCKAYYHSQGYSSYSRFIAAEDAILLFLPNLPQFKMEMATPLPKERQEWLQGFKLQQAIELAMLELV